MKILVTGGAGYIGSHTAADLLAENHSVITVDNLSRGHKKAVLGGKFYIGDLRDAEFLHKVFRETEPEAVIHFAADSQVGESMENPLKYYHNNFVGSLTLLTCMKEFDVRKIVFSSTCAIYGEPRNIPIVESDPALPANPYGETKLAFEKCLKWADKIHGIRHVILRYFNAAGAHPREDIGEDHAPETHIIPLVLSVALGQREFFSVFGNDYPTPDGTCIRDYIHVTDLASAHLLALTRLNDGMESAILNLGNGSGFSVQEVIEKAREVTGCNIPCKIGPRRSGDPARLIGSSQKAREILGWNPRYADLGAIIMTAWKWHKKHPRGYEDRVL